MENPYCDVYCLMQMDVILGRNSSQKNDDEFKPEWEKTTQHSYIKLQNNITKH